jgi:hypothetical protein
LQDTNSLNIWRKAIASLLNPKVVSTQDAQRQRMAARAPWFLHPTFDSPAGGVLKSQLFFVVNAEFIPGWFKMYH